MESYKFRLPATSANLGPGFDAVGLALSLYLNVDARMADEFSIRATGRNANLVGALRKNLMLDTYRAVAPHGPALELEIHNEIPLGMGCGSSAAALVAGVLLASRFGGLGWTRQQVLEEACKREGHPDNVAACFCGGMTVSAMQPSGAVTTASFGGDLKWRLLLALPKASLATEKARALLPVSYSRADTVANLQATALLVSAFAQGRPELLRVATRDFVHQPYRMEACPLLPRLMELAGEPGFYSVTLSGAGPSVLLIADAEFAPESLKERIRGAADEADLELLEASVVAPEYRQY
jgi:homoserine kinase